MKYAALNGCLKYDHMILILNHLQILIKLPHQPGIYYASTIVEISPMIISDDLSNEIQWSYHNICYEIFLSGIACLFSTFAKEAARASSILCRTLR
jgi:hypothetical protein